MGYDKAADIAHHAHHHQMSLREAAIDLGILEGKEFDRLVDPSKMIGPAT